MSEDEIEDVDVNGFIQLIGNHKNWAKREYITKTTWLRDTSKTAKDLYAKVKDDLKLPSTENVEIVEYRDFEKYFINAPDKLFAIMPLCAQGTDLEGLLSLMEARIGIKLDKNDIFYMQYIKIFRKDLDEWVYLAFPKAVQETIDKYFKDDKEREANAEGMFV